jgi:hypothetical protein
MRIKRCENGYTVEFDKPIVRKQREQLGDYSKDVEIPGTTRETRVFITNSDLLEFVEEYFKGEPKP